MRILMIGPLPPDQGGKAVGGVAAHTFELSKGLANLGVDVYVASDSLVEDSSGVVNSLATLKIPPPSVRSALRYFGLRWHPLDFFEHATSFSKLKQGIAEAAYAEIYIAAARKTEAELIHIQGTGAQLNGARKAARALKTPLVATSHSLRGTLPEAFIHDVTLPSLRKADHIITVSKSIEIQLREIDPELGPISTVYSGVDRKRFFPVDRVEARKQLGLNQDTAHILFVGNLVPVKGCDVLIRAFAMLLERNPDAELHFLGDRRPYTDEQWFRSLKALPVKLGVEKSVHFHGHVESNESGRLRLWYSAADCTLLPSLDEGFGLVALESMACGTPAIGSEVGGIPEIIRHEQNGLLTPAGNPTALSVAIQRMLEDSAFRSRLINNLEETVSRFSWRNTAGQVHHIYSKLLANVS